METRLDMTMMRLLHAAFRRDLDRMADMESVENTVGWELFTAYLRIHHEAVEESLLPLLEDAPLLRAVKADHAAIAALVSSADVAGLRAAVNAHLDRVARDLVPLVDATVSEDQYRQFGAAQRDRVMPDAHRYLPWLLDGVSATDTAAALDRITEPARSSYHDGWRQAYAELDLWPSPRSAQPA